MNKPKKQGPHSCFIPTCSSAVTEALYYNRACRTGLESLYHFCTLKTFRQRLKETCPPLRTSGLARMLLGQADVMLLGKIKVFLAERSHFRAV